VSAILRVFRRERNFTQVENGTLRDKRLSYRARGILGYLLSQRDGWIWDANELADLSPTEGRFAILTALKELEAHGYLRRRKVQGDRGRWRTDVEVHEVPLPPRRRVTGVQSPNVG
jgi:hypothetical protein